ncbi:hypothetical protein [Streptomyces yunnanensis]|uniref:Uncharacterized protein n=1 Tax=Streptomyces yunnanensis TaxID=156453 RepID=A0A9X8QML2_9ACTN|nr:hypothetical protein [Streptomyces yunnanensis]SHK76827.1 hypothetical protein SAMN05216268_101254 [Streptomyces yunnanensis]
MCDIGGDGFDADGLDPDALLWVRGVDYLTGWRDATRAAAELGDALAEAGVDVAAAKLRAVSAADGSGVVRLELSPATARKVAKLARVAAA